MQIHLVGLNGRFTHSCLSLFYVRNELENHLKGCETVLHQLTINDPYYDTFLKLTEKRPAIIFFSVYIWSSDYVKRLVHDLIAVLPDVIIVLGGPQAPFMGTDLPGRCTIVRGEVEGLPDDFYRHLAENSLQAEYAAAPGARFTVPYRDEDFAEELKNRHVYYESSRGCPFSCTYCLSSVERGVCHREVEEVKAELAAILAHKPKTIRFVDRTFNTQRERTVELWRFLADQPGDTVFHFEIAPDRFDDEMLSFLATVPAGRFQFEIGIQSTNPETLKAVRRVIDTEQAKTNIKKLAGFGNIHLHVDLILGLPFETTETFRDSFNIVFRLAPHYIQMGLLKILPETPISGSMDEFGMVCCGQAPYEILATRWMNHEKLSALHRFGECVESFYNNRFFKSVFDYIRNTGEEPFAFFDGLCLLGKEEGFFDKAHTQELMSGMLFKLAETRQDRSLLHELLRYDWLSSGHRFLPKHLETGPDKSIKEYLYKRLPQNLEPFYTYKNRDRFFKRGDFRKFSQALLSATGLGKGEHDGYVCFLPETEGILKRRRAVPVPLNES